MEVTKLFIMVKVNKIALLFLLFSLQLQVFSQYADLPIHQFTLPKMMVESNISVYSKKEMVAIFSYSLGRFISFQEYYERYQKTFVKSTCEINSYEEYREFVKNNRSKSHEELLKYINEWIVLAIFISHH